MQVCTSLQTHNHASTPPLSFLQAGCPSCCPTNNIKALKEILFVEYIVHIFVVFSFDTASVAGPLIFADQFIEISSATDTGMIYGLGEHRARLLHNASAMWQQYVMWSRDNPPAVYSSTIRLITQSHQALHAGRVPVFLVFAGLLTEFLSSLQKMVIIIIIIYPNK